MLLKNFQFLIKFWNVLFKAGIKQGSIFVMIPQNFVNAIIEDIYWGNQSLYGLFEV